MFKYWSNNSEPLLQPTLENTQIVVVGIVFAHFITATCFSNVAVMGSLDVRPSVRLSVCL